MRARDSAGAAVAWSEPVYGNSCFTETELCREQTGFVVGKTLQVIDCSAPTNRMLRLTTSSSRPLTLRLAAPYAFFWLLVAAVCYLGMDALISPKVARAVATDGSGIVVIERSHDQHFYVDGSINGYPVTFLVDTGATLVSVGEDLAEKIGLSSGFPAVFNTASGRMTGRIVSEANVQIGGIRVEGIRVGINPSGTHALLGQNFLNKVELTQGTERMVVRTAAVSSGVVEGARTKIKADHP
jgi:aspartyl protease family protein